MADTRENGADLVLYSTATRGRERFVPEDPTNVRMYVCGPTVYDDAHIGNARPVIVFDVLFRLLRHIYGASHVTYVRNVTDVDDKINARAAERGISIRDLTEETLARFREDVEALGCLPPTVEPRATEHVEDMKAMIEALLASGHAYVGDGHVLFDVSRDAAYGRLANRSLEEMRAGARVEVAPYKRGPLDFVLWKPSAEGEPAWESPGGIDRPGRPGWHIECSAMARRYLGETFDIHGGGIDLVFPHHENESAQSRCAFSHARMARHWLHNGFLQVEGRKMAKSEGNFVTIRELLADWPGDVLRLNMLKTHYRQPIDWTVRGLEESHRNLADWAEAAGAAVDPDAEATAALLDDLNTPAALTRLHRLAADAEGGRLGATLALLGIDGARFRRETEERQAGRLETIGVDVGALVKARLAARARKDFAEADRIRDALAAKGIRLKDGRDPQTGEPVTTWEVVP